MLEIRILELFSKSGMNRQEFAAKLGISNAVMSHISSGRNKASMDLVLNILTHFPDISPDWLLLGKGEMKRSEARQLPQALKADLLNALKQLRDAQRAIQIQVQDLENKVLGYS